MKSIKMLLVVVAVILTSATQAETVTHPDSVSLEIENMLKDFKSTDGKTLEVTLFFSVSEDQKIQSLSVASENKEVCKFLEEKLANKTLPADWMKGKIYELTVVKPLC
ncbi:hypothetical protein HC174_14165 [Salinimicrobium sp. CDJ15-81-2]|uniref:TonB C-terminal domain-containing protein n=1 Tax=Tamlana crocina TaxID=393006 RepID=A0ABX1DLV5_9FLAO|nr:hypothetical protein [Tamlana crocina]NJX17221.1 hypothetical protein [Tamlana crocina]NJY63887.1 hypothetical protein [Salinimicrobium nanhaiense]